MVSSTLQTSAKPLLLRIGHLAESHTKEELKPAELASPLNQRPEVDSIAVSMCLGWGRRHKSRIMEHSL